MSQANGNGYRPKLKLDVNVPVVATLLYDEPKLVPSQYGGDQYLYGVETNGEEYSLFLDPPVSQMIEGLQIGRGEPFEIAKLSTRDGNRRGAPRWKVRRIGDQEDDLTGKLQRSIDHVQRSNGTAPYPDSPADSDVPPELAGPAAPAPREQQGAAPRSDQHAANRNQPITSPRPLTVLEDALCKVVSACHKAAEHAKGIGFQMPPFSSDDISKMAMTLVIDKRGGSR